MSLTQTDLCGGAEMGPFCSMVNLLFVFLRSFLSLSDNLRQWRLFRKEFAERIMLRNILGSAMINTEKEVLSEIPIKGWQYNDGDGGWRDDDTLNCQGRIYFQLDPPSLKLNFFIRRHIAGLSPSLDYQQQWSRIRDSASSHGSLLQTAWTDSSLAQLRG